MVRAAAAVLLQRMMAQSLHGPRVVLVLGHLLPLALVATIQVLTRLCRPCRSKQACTSAALRTHLSHTMALLQQSPQS